MPYFAPIRSEQYPATDETQCITVYIPAGDEFKALLAGLIALAIDRYNYDEPDSAQADGLAAVWDTAYSEIDWTGCIMPADVWKQSRQLVFPNSADSWFGTTSWQSSPSSPMAGLFQLASGLNNYIKFDRVTLKAGSYVCRIWGNYGTSYGIATIDIDGTDKTTIDLYAASPGNGIKASGTFTIAADITCPFWIRMKSKNASSSGYLLQWNWIEFDRYAD